MKLTYPTHHKLRGEWAQWQFVARALAMGFRVALPLGECCRYDVLVDNPTGFHRVQVKSSIFHDGYSYRCNCHASGKTRYTPEEFDFMAVYLIPEDTWYIVPAEAANVGTMRLFPPGKNKKNRFHQYREAWELLLRPSTLTIHAAAEEAPALLWFDPHGLPALEFLSA